MRGVNLKDIRQQTAKYTEMERLCGPLISKDASQILENKNDEQYNTKSLVTCRGIIMILPVCTDVEMSLSTSSKIAGMPTKL